MKGLYAAAVLGLAVLVAAGCSDERAKSLPGQDPAVPPAPAPTVSSLAPGSGPASGGTLFTIVGTGFQAGAGVLVAGAPATGVSVVGTTGITAVTPPGKSGPAQVLVTNPDGQSATVISGFTYLSPIGGAPVPTVSAISPASGPAAGGTLVTVSGQWFQAGAGLSIGGASATGVTVLSATTLVGRTPAGTGTATVIVTNPGGVSGALSGGFTYIGTGTGGPSIVPPSSSPPATPVAPAGPTLSAVTPASGPQAGGTVITLTGTGLRAGSTVLCGTATASSVQFVSSTTLTAVTPAGAPATVSVTVIDPSTQSATLSGAFTYVAPVGITAVRPTGGPVAGGTAVTLSGWGFQSGATITFGGALATGVSTGATAAAGVTPAGSAGAVAVVLTNPDGTSATLPGGFTYWNPSGVPTAVTPTTGPTAGGTRCTITGTGFQAGATVAFGGAPATSVGVVGPTQITAVTPAGAAGSVSITVTNPGAQPASLAGAFTYVVPPPVLTSVSPASGPVTGFNNVMLQGSGFQSGATVTLGGVLATGVQVRSASLIYVLAPAGSAGAVNVTVTNPGGASATLTGAYTYVGPAPTVLGVYRAYGQAAGGTPVTVSGQDFQTGATVDFGGATATNVTVVSAAQLTCLTPAGAIGPSAVTVTNPDGQSGVKNACFTYTNGLAVSGLSVTNGPVTGGTTVTVVGAGFQSGVAVDFDGLPATGLQRVDEWTLVCATPMHLPGWAAVTVTNPAPVTGPLTAGYAAQTVTRYAAFAFTTVGVSAGASAPVWPAEGPAAGGTVVTVTGSGFQSGAVAAVGGTAATNVTVWSSTQLTCTVPPAVRWVAPAAGVTVTNPDGSSWSVQPPAAGFVYRASLADSAGNGMAAPHLADDGAGGLHLVARGGLTPGTGTVRYRRSTDGGASWGGTVVLDADTTTSGVTTIVQWPRVIAQGRTVAVVWSRATPAGLGQYQCVPWVAVSTDGGTTFGSAAAVPGVTGGLGRSGRPHDVAFDGSGNLQIVAEDTLTSGVQVIVIVAGTTGGSFGSARRVSASGSHAHAPRLAVVGSNIQVAWVDRGAPGSGWTADVHHVRSTDGGATFSGPAALTTDHVSTTAMITARGSRVVCGWLSGGRLTVRASTDTGASFAATAVSVGTASAGGELVCDGSGTVLAAWERDDAGTGYHHDVFVAHSADGGATWGTPVNHTDNLARAWSGARLYSQFPTATQSGGVFTLAYTDTWPGIAPRVRSY